MDFDHILNHAIEMLQRRGRLTYRTLKRQFGLDEEALEDLKEEFIDGQRLARDEEGRVLVWIGPPEPPETDRHLIDGESRLYALLPDVIARLQRDGRVRYRTLKYIFWPDDALLDEVRRELTFRQLARDEHGAVATAPEEAEWLIRHCATHDLASFLEEGACRLGRALVLQDHLQAGIERMRRALETMEAAGTRGYITQNLAALAEALMKAGQWAQAAAALESVFARMEACQERHWEAELHRLKGELLSMADDRVQDEGWTPEDCFRNALDIARRQQVKSLELRAAASLARLWRSQGRRQDAYDLLAPVYGWFTEGFETADLMDAKGLLEALASEHG